MRKLIIFTDLDGTLLDQAYSFEPAQPALSLLGELNIPVVICSSKTRLEIERYRRLLNNNYPFIAENGGGIFIPHDYFGHEVRAEGAVIASKNGYVTVNLGEPYSVLRDAMDRLRQRGFKVRGFGDMTVEEVSGLTGLGIDEAILAKAREFDEPFVFEGNEKDLPLLLADIASMGLSHTRGALLHLLKGSDKGRAVSILAEAYQRQYGEILTVALGDSENDLPMLRYADRAVIIRKPDGSQITDSLLRQPLVSEKPGPSGWNDAMLELVRTFV